MSAFDYDSLASHAGHRIECVIYGEDVNAAVECVDCGCVLIDFDNTDDDDSELPINNVSMSVPEDDFFGLDGEKIHEFATWKEVEDATNPNKPKKNKKS